MIYDFKDEKVVVVLGSESDFKAVKDSGALKVFEEVGVPFSVAVISAHRNLVDLIKFCKEAVDKKVSIFIAFAGMAAALPGAIAGATRIVPVIGVPADEKGISSVIYMPPGVPVSCSGVGTAGLKNAAILACQMLALGDEEIKPALKSYFASSRKECWHNVPVEEIMKK